MEKKRCVVSLLRFKSVCKSWHSLIESSFFIDLHTATTFNSSYSSSKFGSFILHVIHLHVEHRKHSIVNEILMLSSEFESGYEYGDWYWGTDGTWHNNNNKFTGGGWHWDNTNCSWYWVTFDEDDHQVFKVGDDDDQLVLKLDSLGLLPSKYYNEVIACSCNGLICLYESILVGSLKGVSLWNPATRQLRRLPKSITIEKRGESDKDIIAFGFDVKTKDYKVVKFTCFTPTIIGENPYGTILRPECICRVQVYCISTDSWRLLEGINSLPGEPVFEQKLLYLNGSCFFIAEAFYTERKLGTNGRFIISFDFTKEIITTMELPDCDDRLCLHLGCLGGEKMVLFTTIENTSSSSPSSSSSSDYEDCEYYTDCDIWVLNEHGCGGSVNKESWNKLHSFQTKYTGRYYFTQLRGISNDGKFALLETRENEYRRMQLYNLVTKEAEKDFLPCHSVLTADVYKPSLVSIIGGNGAAAAAPNDWDGLIGGAM